MARNKQVGSLFATLGLKDTGFYKGVRDAERSIKRFGASTTAVAGKVAAVAGAVTAGAVAFGYFFKTQADAADQLSKTAKNLDISTEKLGELQYAASLAGSSMEGINSALETMSVNIGKAAMGQGKAGKWLQALGLDPKELKSLDVSKQFDIIKEKINALSDSSMKAAASTAIFGNSFKENIEFMSLSNKELEAMAKEARDLGVTLNEIEVEKIKNAGDQFDRLKGAVKGVANVVAETVAPYISYLGDELIGAANKGDTWKEKLTKAAEKVETAFSWLITVWAAGKAAIGALMTGVSAFHTGAIAVADAVYKAFAWSIGGILHLSQRAEMEFKRLGIIKNMLSEDPAVVHQAGLDWEKSTAEIGKLAGKGFIEGFEKQFGLEGVSDALDKYLNENIEALAEWQAATQDALGDVGDKTLREAFKNDLEKIRQKYQQLAEEAVKAQKKLPGGGQPDLSEKEGKAGKTIYDELDGLLNEGEKLGDQFDDWKETFEVELPRATRFWHDELTWEFTDLAKRGELTFKNIKNAIVDMAMTAVFNKAFSGIVGGVLNAIMPSATTPQTVTSLGRAEAHALTGTGPAQIFSQTLNFGMQAPGVQQEILNSVPSIKSATISAYDQTVLRRGGR